MKRGRDIINRTGGSPEPDNKESVLEQEAKELHARLMAKHGESPSPSEEAEAEMRAEEPQKRGPVWPGADEPAENGALAAKEQPELTQVAIPQAKQTQSPEALEKLAKVILERAAQARAKAREEALGKIAVSVSDFAPTVFNTYAFLVQRTQDKDVSAQLTIAAAIMEIGMVMLKNAEKKQ